MVRWMAETSPDFGDEHIVIHIDANGPVDLEELHESLAALARIYRRHYPTEPEAPPAKLYVTKVSTGSIDIEIVPLLAILGMPIPYMDAALVVREFTRWIGGKLRSVSEAMPLAGGISRDEAHDLNAFVSPMTGRKGAELGITHAKFVRKERTGRVEREILAEYKFNEAEINRAASNLRKTEDSQNRKDAPRHSTEREVLMAFQQADKSPGKEKGRTGDRVIIAAVSSKPLPVYFPKEAASIKRRILEQTENPFSKGYVVDVVVQYAGDDQPKLYSVIELHDIVDLD